MNNKGGVVNDLIGGTANLIILVVITLVIVSTILAANLLGTGSRTTTTVTNESDDTTTVVFANRSGYIVDAFVDAQSTNTFVITAVWNSSSQGAGNGGFNISVPTTNVSITNTGNLTNATTAEYSNISISYTYTNVGAAPAINTSAGNFSTNFSSGINNISTRIPTILLIAAVVILFGVLVLLVAQARRAGMFGGSSEL